MSGGFDALLDDFLEDASGHLSAVESSLLTFEKGLAKGEPDRKLLTHLLGSLHTLKGNAGMMGFSGLQQYVHTLEEVLKRVAEGILPVTSSLVETLLCAVTNMRERLRTPAGDGEPPLDFSDEITLLSALFCDDTLSATDTLPDGMKVDDTEYLTRNSAVVKVSFDKLDDLLNLVGELIIQRTALAEVSGRLKQVVRDRGLLLALNDTNEQLSKTAGELRDAIMKVRMLPVGSVFTRFERLVRDLSRRHGKVVRFLLEGEDTDLDKTVIDQIGEPLLHLIRNAVDHGIEKPEERVASGKPETGTLKLSAAHQQNAIVISVEDDGRGISVPRVKELARRQGLIDPLRGETLSDEEVYQLLFAPGFSTTTSVTETSGRGIGLDVVKNTILSLNGTIEVTSTPGRGTSFTMKLPLTLAIITALLVQVAGETFAIPLSAVHESVRVSGEEIHETPSGEILRLRDRLLPLVRLDRYLGLPPLENTEAGYVVVLGSGEKRAGIVVDRLVGQQEIVIRGMDDYLGDLPGISGATVLGSGKVALILDVQALLEGQKRGVAGNVRE